MLRPLQPPSTSPPDEGAAPAPADIPAPIPSSTPHRRPPDPDRRIALGILLVVFAVYSLLASRERAWGDARIMYDVADQLIAKGSFAIPTDWPPMSLRGRDGQLYSIYGLFASLVSVPGVALRRAVDHFDPQLAPLSVVVTLHLAHSLAAALTSMLFFRLARRLGASRRAASAGVLVLAFATMVFVYARVPYSEALQGLFFLGFIGELGFIAERPSRAAALALGAWAGALVNTKLIFLLAVAGGGVFLVAQMARRPRELGQVLLWACATGVPLLLLTGAYNYLRWGNALSTGYDSMTITASENVLVAAYGFLFSLGKGLFVFCPPLLVVPFALRGFPRPTLLLAFAASAGPVVLAYCRYIVWGGDYAWGPRYLVFIVPVALLPLVFLIDRALTAQRRRTLAAVGLVAALGVAVQLLGSCIYWDQFIRIAITAKETWLGRPDRSGARVPTRGAVCGACFEDMFAYNWLPPFSPITGQAWLFRHVVAGDDLATAEQDAPWHRYTTLRLNIADGYNRARVDWWVLLWLAERPELRKAGATVTLLFLGLGAWGLVLWGRPPRPRSATVGEQRREPGPARA
jgi:hypothetical protein